MRRFLVVVQAPVVLAVALALPASAHSRQHELPAAATCDISIEVTAKRAAVRDEARADAPIVTGVKKGDILQSCTIAIGRGEPYFKCGAEHYDWYLVSTGTPKSGYLPVTSARKL